MHWDLLLHLFDGTAGGTKSDSSSGNLKIDALIFIWISEDKDWSFHATQGPLPNTCGSFWEMVWEQRSRGVVMLNRVIEKGSVSGCLVLTVHLLPGYPVYHAEVRLSLFLLHCLA